MGSSWREPSMEHRGQEPLIQTPKEVESTMLSRGAKQESTGKGQAGSMEQGKGKGPGRGELAGSGAHTTSSDQKARKHSRRLPWKINPFHSQLALLL